ncbi:MAG: AMP-binding protein [Spirochaetes bacterium]|nr:AMP-binding protein [Spirochaetota bacterium]
MLSVQDYVVRGRKGYKTLLEMIEKNCQEFSEKVAFQMKVKNIYEKITYGELWDKLNQVAKALRKMFLLPGERVAVYSENRPKWGISYMSIMRAGGVVVPLDAQLGPSEIEYIPNHARVKFIFVSKKLLENVKEVWNDVKSLKKIICFDEIKTDHRNILTFNDITGKGAKVKHIFMPKPRPDNLLAILYTSGTTGVAKGVMLTHRNIVTDIESGAQMILFDHTDTFLSVLPIHHSFEGTAGFMLPLYNGAAITYAESLKSANILANIKETNVTLMLGVPLLFEKLYKGILKAVKEKPLPVQVIFFGLLKTVKTIRKMSGKKIGKKLFRSFRDKAGLTSIRFFVSGGGPLRPDVAEAFDDLGMTILQGYGLTETSPVVTVSTLEYMNYYSVGLTIPEVEVKIDKPDERGIGEILVKGNIVMKGYYKNKKATKEVIKNNWFYTGDEGYIDKQGFVYITGRKKNIIVTAGGKNVFPEEIEAKLDATPFIMESMVYGEQASEKDRSETISALVVPDYQAIDEHSRKMGIKYTEDKIRQLVNDEIRRVCTKMPVYKRISNFKIHTEELQKTSTRKIKRYLYLERKYKIK